MLWHFIRGFCARASFGLGFGFFCVWLAAAWAALFSRSAGARAFARGPALRSRSLWCVFWGLAVVC